QAEASAAALAFLQRTAPPTTMPMAASALAMPSARSLLAPVPVAAPFYSSHLRFLIWAVTGAGKTEMIFPLLEHEVLAGRRVVVATPRRDVVLELLPRMRVAFPHMNVVALYGGSEDRGSSLTQNGGILLSTTHQLLRFRNAFDLAVIDEVDAFPYHNDPMLQFAAAKSVKPDGRCIYLSATPPAGMRREAEQGRLDYVRVPVRYHRHPLPVPWFLRASPLHKILKTGKLPDPLLKSLNVSIRRGAQIFLFVPQIAMVDPLVTLLQTCFPELTIEGTSSKDDLRADKVTAFRQKNTNLLVTTTILERGVTVPKSDVFVLDADSPLFDEAALAQMAGRAGRSKDDPAGRVVFVAASLTKSQAEAVRQIRKMNTIARKKGFLLDKRCIYKEEA
ncbi:helicase-related protein, partial [Gorillibacterium massiliense]|uniref:helicase-related protein n=1 Tax=Gorillibacterium massiliense TaxID=1280390 RepID=UPI0006941DBC